MSCEKTVQQKYAELQRDCIPPKDWRTGGLCSCAPWPNQWLLEVALSQLWRFAVAVSVAPYCPLCSARSHSRYWRSKDCSHGDCSEYQDQHQLHGWTSRKNLTGRGGWWEVFWSCCVWRAVNSDQIILCYRTITIFLRCYLHDAFENSIIKARAPSSSPRSNSHPIRSQINLFSRSASLLFCPVAKHTGTDSSLKGECIDHIQGVLFW